MSLLFRALPLTQLARSRPAVIYNVTRKYADYTLEELAPGPYPKTKKEREAAAKKYGLLPHEYEPWPDNGFGKGDYPKLPDISGDSRGPYYPWDYPEHRRNFNETWHSYHDLIHMDRDDPNEKYPRPMWQMFAIHIGVVGSVIGLFFFLEDYKHGLPVMQKQFPKVGGPHYTFEPATTELE